MSANSASYALPLTRNRAVGISLIFVSGRSRACGRLTIDNGHSQLLVATTINCFPSRVYGEMEFHLSCIKVASIIIIGEPLLPVLARRRYTACS